MWYRVFCRSDNEVKPDDLLAHLTGLGIPVQGQFRGDDRGWAVADLRLTAGSPVFVERYLTDADGLRNDLNTWAAYLETLDYSPNYTTLMEHVIQSRQMVTVRKPLDHPNEVLVERLCEEVCRQIAAGGDGIYQIDNDGWYSAKGLLLLKEY
jgi:hypothetical protein